MRRFLIALALLPWSSHPAIGQNSQQSCRELHTKELKATPRSSLLHFRRAECFLQVKDRAAAVNEFREALNGDLEPSWIKVWSHLNMGKMFDITGQRERALNEYRLAEKTNDNTRNAQREVAEYQRAPHKEP